MEEFVDLCVGRSPIVQELMRHENVASSGSSTPVQRSNSDSSNGATCHRRRRLHSSWLRGIRNVAGSVVASSRDCRSSDDKDTCSEKGGRRSSSATDDSQDSAGAVHHGPVRIKVRQYGKSYKEFSGLFMNQEIQAHDGSIWSIRFSPDGRYLASAGEDCVIHVWEVSEFDRKREKNGACNPFVAMVCNGSPEPTLAVASSVYGSNRFPPLYCQGHCLGEDCLFLCGETKALKSYSEAIQNTLQLGYKAEMAKGLGIGCTYGIARMSWALVFWCVDVFIGNGLTDGASQSFSNLGACSNGKIADYKVLEDDPKSRVLLALRAVIKCIEEYKLQKEYSLEPLQKRVSELNPKDEKRPSTESGIKCVQLNGAMNITEKGRAIDTFTHDADYKVFLMSLKAGGVALNLTVASHVFLMDNWWNPAVENQAQDRIHRIGQFKPIKSTRFVIKDTVEERILQLQQKQLVFEGTVGDSLDAMSKLTEADLKFLFQI
uniref:FRIGIDA-like protein n=1 Tax=Zea mays TaxID=4577 RepID=A0A804NQQ1_MAIZE